MNLSVAFGEVALAGAVVYKGVGLAKTAAKISSSGASSGSSSPPTSASGIVAALFPGGAPTMGRQDAGRDGEGKPNTAINAPGNGNVIAVPSDPGGFGDAYPVIHFTSGPWSGLDVYFGHTHSLVSVGQQIMSGQAISMIQDGTGPYVGNAAGIPGHFEIGLWGANGPLNNGQLPPGL